MNHAERQKRFARGLTLLSEATRQDITELTLEVYTESLSPEVDPDEWAAFVRWALKTGRFPTWFPKLAELRDALREFRGEPNLETEATAAYEAVLASGTYTAEGGTTWNYRGVMERAGKAAAEGFLAAGGHHAFASSYHEAERRARFVEAYIAHVRAVPRERYSALPPGAVAGLLPAAEATDRPITAQEAREILRDKIPHIEQPPAVQQKRRWIDLDDPTTAKRVEMLKRQAAELLQAEQQAGGAK